MDSYTNSHTNGAASKESATSEKVMAIEMEPSTEQQQPDSNKTTDEEHDEVADWEEEEAEDDDDDDKNLFLGRKIIALMVEKTQLVVKTVYRAIQKVTRGYFGKILFLVLYLAYFITALCYRSSDEGAHRLIGVTLLMAVVLFRHYIIKGILWAFTKMNGSDKPTPKCVRVVNLSKLVLRWLLYVALAVIIIWTLVDEGKKRPSNLRSLPGLAIFVLICLFISVKPSKINWHTVYWSLGLQFLFALFALRWETGKNCVYWLQRRVDEYFAHTKAGSTIIFGENYAEHLLIFGALPVFLFTNATIAILYYLGAMQFVVRVIGNFLEFVLETTPLEAVGVALGIFLEGMSWHFLGKDNK